MPEASVWGPWMEVLLDSVALLGLCYSMSTLDVYVSAVSAFMQDAGMASPYESREFKMLMEAMRRRKGLGKKKSRQWSHGMLGLFWRALFLGV